ncbi:MAG: tripartite tricarboxylate transporter permease [Planctomycetota bacterium]|jgi:putative tricarboxylic transport membrane protein|nr:tripartite tricarboxylate transporter permease [Planctomycetota bacterium]
MLIFEVLQSIISLESLLFMNVGVAAGIVIGALPGLTPTMGIAILLPLTFGMAKIPGMMLMLGVYCGGIYGGSITAILLRTPGTPAAAATAIDGFEMARQGNAGRALTMALKASLVGGLLSALSLLLVAPQLAAVAIRFGPPEYFALCLFGLTIISSVSTNLMTKGLLAGFLGLFASTIGIDPISGYERMTFGIWQFQIGIKLIPALIGLFAISELMDKTKNIKVPLGKMIEYKKQLLAWWEVLKYWKTLLVSSAIGIVVGATPGTGAAISSFLAYNIAKTTSKHHKIEEFGEGCIEGVAAAETANNGVTGATLIPLLTLGIPGDSITAVLLGALMMQGITPGPRLFIQQPHWVYCVILGLFFVNLFMYAQGKLFIRVFINVVKVPAAVLVPMLFVLCILGSYAASSLMFDVYVTLAFGFVGYILIKFDYPVTPMVIAIVLGSLTESNLRRSLIISGGSIFIFFTRPISLLFIIISIITLFYPLVKKIRAKKVVN